MNLDILWIGLYGSLAVLCAATFWSWLRLEPASRRRALVCLLLAAVWLTVFHARAGRVPVDWVTPLHEGTGRTNLLQLYGEAAHSGLNFAFVRRLWLEPERRDLRDVVRMNTALAGLNACLYLLIAWSVLGRLLPALGFTLLFAANRNYVHAALSEVPGQLLTLFFLLGVLAAAVLRRCARAPAGAWRAWSAWLMLVVLTLLAGWTRIECAMTGVLAAALGLARLMGARDAGGDFLWRRLEKILGWGVLDKAGLLLLLAVLSVRWWDAPERWTWVPDGLRPFNPSFLLLPAFLWDYLPAGLVVLTLAGFAHSVRNIGGFLGLPVSLIVLYRTYHSAGSASYCDMFRYATHWTPMVLVLALFGWKEIASLLGPKARRAALALVLVLFLIPPGGPVHALYSGGRASREHRLWRGHNQEEVRFLLKAMDENPDTVFVTRLTAGWAFFGKPLPFVVFDKAGAASLGEELRGQRWVSHEKMLFYRGLDCSLEGMAQGCMEQVPGARPVRELEFANPRLCDPSEYDGGHAPRISLGLYEFSLRGEGSGARCPAEAASWDWLSLAGLRLGAGDKEGGLAALECATSAGPKERDFVAIARYYGELRSDERAKPGIRRLVERSPAAMSPEAWLQVAGAAHAAGDIEEALKALGRAESAGARSEDVVRAAYPAGPARPGAAGALARRLSEKGLEGAPFRVWMELAAAAQAAGDPEAALKALERAGSAGPRGEEVLELARALVGLKMPDRTRDALRRLWEQGPARASRRVRIRLAELAEECGEVQAAARILAVPAAFRYEAWDLLRGMTASLPGLGHGSSLGSARGLTMRFLIAADALDVSGLDRRSAARLYLDLGAPERAYEILSAPAGFEEMPTASDWMALGEAAVRCGARDVALKALARAEDAGPGPGLMMELARAYLGLGETVRAKAVVCGLAEGDEGLSALDWIDVAHLAKGAGEVSCARRALERAESAGPEGSGVGKLARAYAEAGLAARALAMSRKAFSGGPLPAWAWLDAAYAARAGGDRALSLKALERARKAGCSRKDREESALQYQALGEHGKALELLDGLIRDEPGSGRLRSDRGVVKALLGRRDEAIADLREAVRLEPDLLEAYVSLGGLLAASGRSEQAREVYRLGMKRCGGSAAGEDMRRVIERELARL
ncbi:MAG: hypothetical protein WC728_12665 [Elusimicrobiota bacterium]